MTRSRVARILASSRPGGWLLALMAAGLWPHELAYAREAQTCSQWVARVSPEEQKRIPAREAVPGKVPAEATPVPQLVFSAPYDQPSDPWGVASLTEAEKLDAIQCLLGEENDLRAGGFGGATRPNVSQLFGPTQANLNALYFISYIYGGNFNHASANALAGNGANIGHWQYVTSDAAIHRAYQAYKIWFSKVRQMGLANARRADLQPLDGTGLSWYGNHVRRPGPCRSDTACAR